jgi:hypothetical protein
MTEKKYRPFKALRVLRDRGVRFVAIGGFAGRVRGSPLITNDLDVCYARDATNLMAMASALRALGATLRGAPPDVPFILDAKTLEMGDRFTFTTNAGSLDIMGAPDGVPGGFDELVRTSDEIEVEEGLFVRVAALEDLIRMKRAAGRPKDLMALEILGALRDEIDDQAAAARARRRRERRSE